MKAKLLFVLNVILVVCFLSCKKDETVPLEAAFDANVQSTVAGGSVVFADRSTGAPSKWKWTFEGGEPASSDLSGPEVTYAVPGTYAVTLEVSNAGGNSVVKKESFITVGYGDVTAAFEADKTTAVQGETITFKDLSTGLPTTWLWEFIPKSGTPITSTEQNPAIKFDNYGVYTVKLTASNPEHSQQVVKTDFINILDVTSVEAAFSSSATATYEGGSITFSDQSVGNAQTVSWTFEGGSPAVSSDRNPVVTYSTPGRYKVTLVASNPNKSSTLEKTQYILVVPASGLQAFFPFNGNANDVSPNRLVPNQTGTVAFSGTDRLAADGNTAVFDGSSYLNVPDHAALNLETDDFSIACWIKTDKTSKMMIWQESGAKGAKDNQTWLRINDNLTTPQYLRFDTEDGSGGTIVTIGNPGRMSDGNWHHVVCVRSGTNTKVYIDGVKMTTEGNAAAVKDVSNESGFKIGAQEGTSYSSYFNGQLDDLIIYKRALTAAEVLALYNL